ncbi:hypothetical protein MASR2M50_24860 [Thauera sp.]
MDSAGRQRRATAQARVSVEAEPSGKARRRLPPTDIGSAVGLARGGTRDRRGSDMVAQSLGRIGAIYAGAREESVMRV